jgi:hypothetical protein
MLGLRRRRNEPEQTPAAYANEPNGAAPERVRGREGEPDGAAVAEPRRRRRFRERPARAGAAAVGAAGSAVLGIAALVMLVAVLIFLLIVAAIVLRDVDANATNGVVEAVHEGANFFAGAFTGLISFSGHPKRAITVNWGIAAIVFLLVGIFVSRLIARVGRGGVLYEQRHRPIPSH